MGACGMLSAMRTSPLLVFVAILAVALLAGFIAGEPYFGLLAGAVCGAIAARQQARRT